MSSDNNDLFSGLTVTSSDDDQQAQPPPPPPQQPAVVVQQPVGDAAGGGGGGVDLMMMTQETAPSSVLADPSEGNNDGAAAAAAAAAAADNTSTNNIAAMQTTGEITAAAYDGTTSTTTTTTTTNNHAVASSSTIATITPQTSAASSAAETVIMSGDHHHDHDHNTNLPHPQMMMMMTQQSTSSTTPTNDTANSNTNAQPPTSVTPQRKEQLLLQARRERSEWIQHVPVPYAVVASTAASSTANSTADSDATEGKGHSDNDEDIFNLIQQCHVVKEVPSICHVITRLYGSGGSGSASGSCSASDGTNSTSTQHIKERVNQLILGGGDDKKNKKKTRKGILEQDKRWVIPTGNQIAQSELARVVDEDDDDDTDTDNANIIIPSMTAYIKFTTTLQQQPSCAMLVQGMRRFCRQYCDWLQQHSDDGNADDGAVAESARRIHSYLRSTFTNTLRVHVAFSKNGDGGDNKTDANEYDERLERSFESLIYGQCYPSIIRHLQHHCRRRKEAAATMKHQQQQSGGAHPHDRDHSDHSDHDDHHHTSFITQRQWSERIEILSSFLTAQHLEIDALASYYNSNDEATGAEAKNDDSHQQQQQQIDTLLKQPIDALRRVETYYSPREKLQLGVLPMYHGVNTALTAALNPSMSNGDDDHDQKNKNNKKLPSADDILPTIILLIIRTRPLHLLTQIQYIEEYATQELLRGETGYAFTNLYGAVQFIQQLDLTTTSTSTGTTSASSLAMSTAEFHQHIVKARDQIPERLAARAAAQQDGQQHENETIQCIVQKTLQEQYSVMGGDGSNGTGTTNIPIHEIRAARRRGEHVDLDWATKYWQRQQQVGVADGVGVDGSPLTTTATTVPPPPPPTTTALPSGLSRPTNYSFLTTSPAEIRYSEIPALLQEYRTLVKTTEHLIGERTMAQNQEKRKRNSTIQATLYTNALEVDPSLLPHSSQS